MAKNTPLGRLREICLALPEAHEQVFGGHTNPTFRVRDKIFVMMSEDPEGKPAMWCKAPLGAQGVLIDSDPKRFFKPPYVGPKGWVGMRLNPSTDWDLARDLALDSYCMTAPKRLTKLLEPA